MKYLHVAQAIWWELGRLVGVLAVLAVLAGRRLVEWQRRPKQAAEKALAWFLWNWASGGKLGAGPEMWDRSDSQAVRRRVALGVARSSGTIVVLALAWSRQGDVGLGRAALAGAGTAVLVPLVVWSVVLWVVLAWHWWRWVVPLHRVLAPMLDHKRWMPSWRWLEVPRSRPRQESRGVRVTVPRSWYPPSKQRDLVVDAVHAKLRLEDVTDRWVMAGRSRFLMVRPAHHAPPTAFLSDPVVQRALASCKPGEVVLGLAAGGKDGPRVVKVSLDHESPHVLVSAGSGGGKSATIRTIAAQFLRRGVEVWVIDPKRHSHAWIRGIPGVRYFRDPGEIHRALLALAAEGDRRNRLWDHVQYGEKGPTFTRVVVVCEEINATANYLRRWWAANKEPGDPQMAPSVSALGEVLFMGRAVQINVLGVAQSATAKDIGGPEARENFFLRILARYTKNAWNMLVPECTYTPASSHPGRAQVCMAGVATETQQVFMTEDQARSWALAGREAITLDVAVSQGPSHLGDPLRHVAHATPVIDLGGPAGELEPALMSIAELSADKGAGIVDARYGSLRQALLRDPESPPFVLRGKTKFYDPEQVKRWAVNRPIAGVKERQKVMAGSIQTEGSDE